MKRIIVPTVLTIAVSFILVYLLFFYESPKKEFIVGEYSELVNPFIGTDFHGHTHPSAMLPFGMVQLGPETRLEGWDGCSGFHYSDSIIYGFAHTHLSGTGVADYGDILLMPFSNFDNDFSKDKIASKFRYDNTVASPGYFSTYLEDNAVNVYLTVTERVGFHKYVYDNPKEKYILLDLEHRDEVLESYVKPISKTRFVGLRRSKSWAENQILYFVMDFSQPVSIVDFESDVIVNDELVDNKTFKLNSANQTPSIYVGKNNRLVFKVDSNSENELLVKVALSATGEEGAIKNLEAEIADWDFEKVKTNAKNIWDKELSKIRIEGGKEDDRIAFYSALYHAYSAPNIYCDVDGKYRARDLENYENPQHTTYTVFSLWDTYRAAHPLYTIVQEKRTLDFIKTFLDQYKKGGALPMWELSANETMCMIGYHSVPVIVDAYFKGIKDFDLELALEAMISVAKTDELGKAEFAKYGYIPLDMEHESVSKALEYAFDDWCIAMFAKDLGKQDVYEEFIERAQFYKNVFNPKNGFMQSKLNAAWQEPFDPKEVNFNFTEANSWQYSFYVPQDIMGFIELHGGNEKFAKKLDEMFSEESQTSGNHQVDITGLIGQYAHGNEPSHHMAYLYNYCGKPWKTQAMARKIMSELYSAQPDGLCGNEDCGQMSAWYVLSAMGFYPVNPANGVYDLGSPLFDKATIQLENGKHFEIIAHDNSEKNIYVKEVKLNGRKYKKSYICHADIMKGGKLEFFMASEPETNRATEAKDIYQSQITENIITPVPFTNVPFRSFRDEVELTLDCADKNAEIYYSINDEENANPQKYKKPIVINSTTKLKAYAKSDSKKQSKTIEAELIFIPDNRTIKLISEYSPQYTAGGDNALIDFIKGEAWFRSGLWQGYRGQDFEAIVDLQEVKEINLINARFLQDIRAWIFFPKKVSYFASNDGVNFTKIYESDSQMPDNDYEVKIQEFKNERENFKARYIKVVAKSYGKLPEWHLSAGYNSWIFIDEIEIY
jgi:predicted alpha-1,2-mannosidase